MVSAFESNRSRAKSISISAIEANTSHNTSPGIISPLNQNEAYLWCIQLNWMFKPAKFYSTAKDKRKVRNGGSREIFVQSKEGVNLFGFQCQVKEHSAAKGEVHWDLCSLSYCSSEQELWAKRGADTTHLYPRSTGGRNKETTKKQRLNLQIGVAVDRTIAVRMVKDLCRWKGRLTVDGGGRKQKHHITAALAAALSSPVHSVQRWTPSTLSAACGLGRIIVSDALIFTNFDRASSGHQRFLLAKAEAALAPQAKTTSGYSDADVENLTDLKQQFEGRGVMESVSVSESTDNGNEVVGVGDGEDASTTKGSSLSLAIYLNLFNSHPHCSGYLAYVATARGSASEFQIERTGRLAYAGPIMCLAKSTDSSRGVPAIRCSTLPDSEGGEADEICCGYGASGTGFLLLVAAVDSGAMLRVLQSRTSACALESHGTTLTAPLPLVPDSEVLSLSILEASPSLSTPYLSVNCKALSLTNNNTNHALKGVIEEDIVSHAATQEMIRASVRHGRGCSGYTAYQEGMDDGRGHEDEEAEVPPIITPSALPLSSKHRIHPDMPKRFVHIVGPRWGTVGCGGVGEMSNESLIYFLRRHPCLEEPKPSPGPCVSPRSSALFCRPCGPLVGAARGVWASESCWVVAGRMYEVVVAENEHGDSASEGRADVGVVKGMTRERVYEVLERQGCRSRDGGRKMEGRETVAGSRHAAPKRMCLPKMCKGWKVSSASTSKCRSRRYPAIATPSLPASPPPRHHHPLLPPAPRIHRPIHAITAGHRRCLRKRRDKGLLVTLLPGNVKDAEEHGVTGRGMISGGGWRIRANAAHRGRACSTLRHRPSMTRRRSRGSSGARGSRVTTYPTWRMPGRHQLLSPRPAHFMSSSSSSASPRLISLFRSSPSTLGGTRSDRSGFCLALRAAATASITVAIFETKDVKRLPLAARQLSLFIHLVLASPFSPPPEPMLHFSTFHSKRILAALCSPTSPTPLVTAAPSSLPGPRPKNDVHHHAPRCVPLLAPTPLAFVQPTSTQICSPRQIQDAVLGEIRVGGASIPVGELMKPGRVAVWQCEYKRRRLRMSGWSGISVRIGGWSTQRGGSWVGCISPLCSGVETAMETDNDCANREKVAGVNVTISFASTTGTEL
ncbi:hypothetical protein R3P38DRAFT_3610200 [Favolaschia claudopus]|uniref:Uncharacterized protein n=1 Tax=Favolaschia claudopus TaxID=2862362 RepID=A0AAW0A6P3_9AGAR